MKFFRSRLTLVELLIVIAILAILAGLLLPSLQNALTVSRKLSCQNNQKQIGIAEASYTDDNHGFYPVDYNFYSSAGGRGTTNKYYTTVQRILAVLMGASQNDPFFDNKGLYAGMADPGMVENLQSNWYNENTVHYMFSGNIHGFPSINNKVYSPQQMHSIRTSQVKNPTICVLFTDTPWWYGRQTNARLKARYIDGGGFGSFYCYYSPHDYFPNVLYTDGHVQSVQRIDPAGATIPCEATEYWVTTGTPYLGSSNATIAAKYWNLLPGRPKKK